MRPPESIQFADGFESVSAQLTHFFTPGVVRSPNHQPFFRFQGSFGAHRDAPLRLEGTITFASLERTMTGPGHRYGFQASPPPTHEHEQVIASSAAGTDMEEMSITADTEFMV